MKDIKVAVIGSGYLGSFHAEKYRDMEGVELVGICDIDSAQSARVSKACRSKPFADYRDLLGKVDAVSIALPTHLHYEAAERFLEGGTDVLIEKPITKRTEEAEKLVKLAASKNLIIQVGHVERFNSAIRAIEGYLKEPRFIECHRLSRQKKRGLEVGVTLDLMIHDIDIVLGLVKSEVENIEAVGINVLSESEDIANARIRFENGTICNLNASRVAHRNMRKIRIFQKDTYISLDYLTQTARIYTKSGKKISSSRIKAKKGDPLGAQLASFIDCVRNRTKPIVSGDEGLKALKVALDIQSKIERSRNL
ncbi:MAG: hypothetical protein AUJ75_03475 [Candidatus Omnitrophica bacterium CG1_02_49_10]|nr:MAG: hypothetical protein AUJ75_03475 [Candidatus Omnitrophica bacterium CG1_02_49_10]